MVLTLRKSSQAMKATAVLALDKPETAMAGATLLPVASSTTFTPASGDAGSPPVVEE